MGIKNINRYFRRNCNQGIKYSYSIDKLRGKRIVVDTSIYMYKYLEENALLENFFIMITQFREYNITPLFIFDGKAHASKMDLLWKRVLMKKNALKELERLRITIESIADTKERKYILEKMEMCRKNSTRVKEEDIVLLKKLFDAMGVYYYAATTEADIVCAYFVKKGLAWACLSDDMDMFVYGCDFVLREWNIHKRCGMLYDRDQIMKEVWVKPEYFSQLLLLLGSDYHQEICKNEYIQVETAFKWYDEFIKSVIILNAHFGFSDWLHTNKKITLENAKKLETIYTMYDIPNHIDDISTVSPTNIINWRDLQKLMAPYGFVM